MAFNEAVADDLRAVLGDQDSLDEKNMFGGIAFMVNGNMTVGVVGDDLCVRVGADAYAEALAEPGAREMDFTGRPMKGWVFVAPNGFGDEPSLHAWVERALAFNATLPPK